MRRRKRLWNFISILFLMVLILSLSFFSYSLFKVNILPMKYIILGFSVLGIFILIILKMLFAKKMKWLRVFSYSLVSIFSGFLLLATTYFDNTQQFFSGTQLREYDTLTYSVIVLQSSDYDNLSSLDGKKISYLDDNYVKDIKKELKPKISYKELLLKEFGELPNDLLNGVTDAICIEEGYLSLIQEEVETFSNATRIIYTFDVDIRTHFENKKEKEIKISKDSFIVYISGIDQYGKLSTVRGRSDVNQIAVVNPRTNHILLVNTPRDYYVQLAGTTGLRDKLTHAGIYGIEKSIATLEGFYDIDIDHYLKVNFDTLIKVVDIIGGIDIYSDKTFTCHTNKSVHVEKGMNHFNGIQALAYSRERYAYIDGDHHRGANQQQVITAILEKVTSSSVIISKYNSILNALTGTFQTDMSTNMITSFIKYQLDKMPSWKVESIAVTGSNSMDYTYSMGTGYKLYVMEPDMESVNDAIQKIKEVYNEE